MEKNLAIAFASQIFTGYIDEQVLDHGIAFQLKQEAINDQELPIKEKIKLVEKIEKNYQMSKKRKISDTIEMVKKH